MFFCSLLLALLILVKIFVHVCKRFVRMITMAIASFICPQSENYDGMLLFGIRQAEGLVLCLSLLLQEYTC